LSNNKGMPPAKHARLFYGWYLVAAAWLMLFLVNAVAVGIFFKPIIDEFGWDRATLSSVQTIALLVFAVFSPFLGKLIDRFGPRAILFISVVAQTLTSVVNGMAASLWQLTVGRFLYEFKPSHASLVLINRWFITKRGKALGIVATGMPIGTLVLSPISQYLVLAWGWRQTLLFWAGVTFIVLLPLTFFIKNYPSDKGVNPDGETATSQPPLSKDASRRLRGTASPGNTLSEAIRSAPFWLLSMSHIICGIGCGFMMTHIVIFATDVGYSPMIGASLLSVQGAVNLIGVLVTGQMSDRHSRSRVLALTHLFRSLSFVAIIIFVLLGGGSLWVLYAGMALFGFGWYTTAPLTSGLVADLFGNRQMGTILGVVLSSHMVGTAIGAYAGGITFDLTGSYLPFFIIQGILELLAASFAFAIKKRRPVEQSQN
jgi:MFS family permease